jgi:type IV pilus biogenesis protein CpaD/CtpE
MKKITALLFLSATLMACSNMPDRRDHSAEWRSDIKREGKIIELSFEPKTSHLTKDQKSQIQEELRGFTNVNQVYARVFVDALEAEPLTATQKNRLKKVKTFLARKGLSGKHIKFYRWKESRFDKIKDDTVMITFDRNRVDPNLCPGWKSKINDHEPADGTPDFGCANSYNNALLVADKNDLIEGKTLRDRDSALKLKAVKSYQADKMKELKQIKSGTTDSGGSN